VEETDVRETRESLEVLEGFEGGWSGYLAFSTALVAVVAAIASLQSGDFANRALIEKNQAVLLQTRAADEWSHYQAKSIKAHLAEFEYRQTHDEEARKRFAGYESELGDIKARAEKLERSVESANEEASRLFERHHHVALSVTTFQIAIALSALSALLKRKSFWILSIGLSVVGAGLLAAGLLS